MTVHEPLTDIELEAMLARLSGRGWTEGLEASIMTEVDATPQQRATWIAWPSWRLSQRRELRPLGYLAIIGLLLALAAGTIALGARLLHQTPQIPDPRTVLVPAWVETLSEAVTYQTTVVDRDGLLWAVGPGTLTRDDPSTGTTRSWTVDNDFRFASAAWIEPARAGGVWLIGRQTLLRFDGTAFGDMVEVSADVTTASEAPDGTLWIGLADGALVRANGSSRTRVAVPRPSVDAVINAVAVDAAGNVWCGWIQEGERPRGWVSRYDGNSWQTFDEKDAAPLAGGVRVIAPMADGSVWVGTEATSGTDASGVIRTTTGGLAYFDGATWTDADASGAALHNTTVTSVAADANGSIWVSDIRSDGSMAVAQRQGDAWTTYGTADGLPGVNETRYSLPRMVLTDGRVFVGTGAGIFELVEGQWVRVWPETAPSGPDTIVGLALIFGISHDEAWVATWGHVWHYADDAWSAPLTPQSSGSIRDLMVTADGTVWVAADDGVYVRSGSAWTRVSQEPARALAIDRQGLVWASTQSMADARLWHVSAYALDNGTWAERERLVPRLDSGRPLAAPDHLAFGQDGSLWAGSEGVWGYAGGLVRYADGAWERVNPRGGDGELIVTDLMVAANGDVWVSGGDVSTSTTIDEGVTSTGTVAGATWIARFDGATWSIYREADHGPALSVGGTLLAVAPDGAIWLATSGGLARFDGATWSDIRSEAAYGGISVAPDGTVWVIGPSGIGRLTDTPAP